MKNKEIKRFVTVVGIVLGVGILGTVFSQNTSKQTMEAKQAEQKISGQKINRRETRTEEKTESEQMAETQEYIDQMETETSVLKSEGMETETIKGELESFEQKIPNQGMEMPESSFRDVPEESREEIAVPNTSVRKEDTVQNPSTQEEKTEIGIPGTIGDTGLTVKQLSGFDGIYVEDGSDEEVVNVATILIRNHTGKNIQYAKLTFQVSNGKQAVFSFSDLPIDGEVMVSEQNRLVYEKGDCYILEDQTIAYMDEFSMMEDQVKVVINDDNSMTVTNLSDREISSLRLFYKYRYDTIYVGGITFTAKLEDLAPGEERKIRPAHFDTNGSELLRIGQYKE